MGKLLDQVVEIHKNTNSGIVSAMRNKDSPTVKRLGITNVESWNSRNHDTLGGIITSRGFDYIELSSTYDEIGENGEKLPSEENSYLVYGDVGDAKRFVVEMGKKYDQDAVVFTPAGGEASLIFTNDYNPDNPIGKEVPIGTLKINVESPYKSVLVKEPESSFVYSEDDGEEEPQEPQRDQVVESYAKAIKEMKLY